MVMQRGRNLPAMRSRNAGTPQVATAKWSLFSSKARLTTVDAFCWKGKCLTPVQPPGALEATRSPVALLEAFGVVRLSVALFALALASSTARAVFSKPVFTHAGHTAVAVMPVPRSSQRRARV